ncbi:Ger(x)C family spore germination protein [Paenibacillus sp. SI8]|uniref:Ger(x)C family spore germination protein n=1 Tax=unclassified Paenibacillus TaxID=185978 RepID=UPI003465F271
MNKRLLRLLNVILIAWIAVFVSGCSDRLDMEDSAISLLIGYDLDEDNQIHFFTMNPAFSKFATKKTQVVEVKTITTRQGRDQLDAQTAGVFHGRKLAVVLVSKRIVQHEDWFRLMDVLFRDGKNAVSSKVVVYDGSLSEIMNLTMTDQPMLPLLLRGMIDTKSARSETVNTTMQELHRQIYEKGGTPSISEIQLYKGKAIKLSGIALLDHRGKYVTSLSAKETVLLKILQNNAKKSFSMTLSIPGESKTGPFHTDKLSFASNKIKTKIKTVYREGKFQFDMKIQMHVGLSEHLFPYDVRNQGKELEHKIAEQVQKQLDQLMKKIQEHQIDPIGLGVYARAFEYEQYKKVEDHWGEALAKADIHVTVKAAIGSMGAVK